jgi:hypothetical protein
MKSDVALTGYFVSREPSTGRVTQGMFGQAA